MIRVDAKDALLIAHIADGLTVTEASQRLKLHRATGARRLAKIQQDVGRPFFDGSPDMNNLIKAARRAAETQKEFSNLINDLAKDHTTPVVVQAPIGILEYHIKPAFLETMSTDHPLSHTAKTINWKNLPITTFIDTENEGEFDISVVWSGHNQDQDHTKRNEWSTVNIKKIPSIPFYPICHREIFSANPDLMTIDHIHTMKLLEWADIENKTGIEPWTNAIKKCHVVRKLYKNEFLRILNHVRNEGWISIAPIIGAYFYPDLYHLEFGEPVNFLDLSILSYPCEASHVRSVQIETISQAIYTLLNSRSWYNWPQPLPY